MEDLVCFATLPSGQHEEEIPEELGPGRNSDYCRGQRELSGAGTGTCHWRNGVRDTKVTGSKDGELTSVGGSAGDVAWMRGLKGRKGSGSPSFRAGAISWDSGLGT